MVKYRKYRIQFFLLIYSYLFVNKFYSAYSLIQLLENYSNTIQNLALNLYHSPFKHFINHLIFKNKLKCVGFFEDMINLKLDETPINFQQFPITFYRNSLDSNLFSLETVRFGKIKNIMSHFFDIFEKLGTSFEYKLDSGTTIEFTKKSPTYKIIPLKCTFSNKMVSYRIEIEFAFLKIIKKANMYTLNNLFILDFTNEQV